MKRDIFRPIWIATIAVIFFYISLESGFAQERMNGEEKKFPGKTIEKEWELSLVRPLIDLSGERALCKGLESVTILSGTDTTGPVGSPTTPTDGGEYTSGAIIFNWTQGDVKDEESGISGYYLQIDVNSTDFTSGMAFEGNVGNILSIIVVGSHGKRYYARVCAINGSGIYGTYSGVSDGIMVDTTPPSMTGQLRDGEESVDIDSTGSITELSANWDVAEDLESGIRRYWYAIGTTDEREVVDWTDNGTSTRVTVRNLNLIEGTTYYFWVKAENEAGLQSISSIYQEIPDEFNWGGIAQGWRADDKSWLYTLPFSFPFYGNMYNSVWVCSNGFLDFTSSSPNWSNTINELKYRIMIAPLWDDLRTDKNSGDDIYIYQPTSDSVCIRWRGVTYYRENTVNFEVILYQAGEIKFNYSSGNTWVTPTIGISNGNGKNYFLSPYNGASNLYYAPSLLIRPYDSFLISDGQTVIGSNILLTVSGTDLAPSMVNQGKMVVIMERLTITTRNQLGTITGIKVDRIGSSTDSDISEVMLFEDTDENGEYTPEVDIQIGSTQRFIGSSATFNGLNIVVTPQNQKELFVVYNIAQTATLLGRVGVELKDSSYITVVTPGEVCLENFPITSQTSLIISSGITSGDAYVNGDNGNDLTGYGTVDNPWQTITFAISQILGTGTIYVSPGIYNSASGESFPIYMKNGVSLVGNGGNDVVIEGESGNAVIFCFDITDRTTRIQGFTIKNGEFGISCYYSSPTIVNNVIYNNYSDGISCLYSFPSVINNTIINNAWGIYFYYWDDWYDDYDLKDWDEDYYVSGIFNNIIANNSDFGIENYNSFDLTIDYNNVWGNGVDYSGCNGGIHNLSSDPKFVDSAYRIGSISLCIDSGTDEAYGVPATDKDGQPRIIRTIDIGAYEYQDTPGWGAICGVITDTSNNLLPGVFVEVLEKQVSVLSDINGAYFIRVPPSNTYTLCASVSTHYPSYRGKVEVTIDQTTSGVDIELVGKEVTTVYVNSENTTWIENGSREYSYTTIQRGVDYIVLLGTVSIAEGRYTESVSINNKEFRLVGAGINTVIDPPSGNGISIYSAGNNLLVANLKVTGADIGIYCSYASPVITNNLITNNNSSGISCCGHSSPSIHKNIIEYNCYEGISCYDDSSPLIADNIIAHNSWAGIYCNHSSGTIINNSITNNSTEGIYCNDYASPLITNNFVGSQTFGIHCYQNSSATIINNLIRGNSDKGIFCEYSSPFIGNNIIDKSTQGGIYCLNSSSPTITNNTLNNNYTGLICTNSSPAIYNNIITNNNYYGIKCISSTPCIDYNAVWNNHYSNYVGSSYGTHNLSVDPKFVDDIYRIGSNSLCLEAGTEAVSGSLVTDKDGYPRQVGRIDIGAYEYQGTPTFDSSICGVIIDTSGNPIPDVIVEISGEVKRYTVSDYEGFYIIPYLFQGTYSLQTSFSGYYPSFRRIKVEARDITYGVNFELVSTKTTTIYVNASNTIRIENGSKEYPYSTIQRGVDCIVPSGTVSVAEGTYTESISINSKEFKLIGAGTGTVIAPPQYSNGMNISNAGSLLLITNFNFRLKDGYGYGLQSYYSSPTIANNIITGAFCGIYSQGSSSASIINNTINENRGGIKSCWFSSPFISNNIITNNVYGYGISCYNSSSPIIINNIIGNNTNGGIYCVGYTSSSQRGTSSPYIINNTIDGGTNGNGIYLASAAFPIIINNIISNNRYYGIREGNSNCDPVKVAYNLFYNNTEGVYYDKNSTVYRDVFSMDFNLNGCGNNVVGEPGFVNRISSNYHLKENSMALNAGSNNVEMTPVTDFEGDSRHMGMIIDIGADESVIVPTRGTIQGTVTAATNGLVLPKSVIFVTLGSVTMVADNNGGYQVSNLVPGTYTVKASKSGYNTNTQTDVKVIAGGISTLNMDLSCAGKDWYVDAIYGSNYPPGDGSINYPWRTITYAMSQVSGSGTIHVASGTYTSTLGEVFPLNMKNNLSLIGAGALLTILDANNLNSVIQCNNITNPNTKIEGFTIKNGKSSYGGGMYLNSSAVTIVNNIIVKNTATNYGGGIYIYHGSSSIINNTIDSNTGDGIYFSGYSSSSIINNIISNNSTYGIRGYGTESISHNLFFNNTSGVYYDKGAGVCYPDLFTMESYVLEAANNISGYTGFVRAEGGNYHLQETSFALNAGTNDRAPAVDFEGNPRPINGLIDIGADESYVTPINGIIQGTITAFSTGIGIPKAVLYINPGGYLTLTDTQGRYQMSNLIPGIYTVKASKSGYAPYPKSNVGVKAGSITTVNRALRIAGPDWYVDNINGSDIPPGDGSIDYPWRTITYALSQISGTGTLYVASGTYSSTSKEIFPIKMKNGLSLVGAQPAMTIIDGAGIWKTLIWCEDISDSATRIEGFTIKNGRDGIYCNNGSSPVIINNIISGNNDTGVICEENSSPSITNNTITMNSEGIYCYFSSPVIANNLINSNRDMGIYCDYSSPSIINNTIDNSGRTGIYIYRSSPVIVQNLISNNTHQGIYCYDWNASSLVPPSIISNIIIENRRQGIYCENFFPLIINNIIGSNTDTGIYCGNRNYSESLSYSASIINNTINNNFHGIYCTQKYSPGIFNNIISNNRGDGILCENSSYPSIDYNNFYGNNIDTVGCFAGSHSISINPRFIDSAYRLGSTSLCINAGSETVLGEQTIDKDGCPRRVGPVDIGAYEYQGRPIFSSSICGTVTDMADNPVSGVLVKVLGAGRYGISNDNGTYIISDLPFGTYNLCISIDGYYPSYQDEIGVGLDSTAEGVDFQLVPKGMNIIYVDDSNTSGIENGSIVYPYSTIQRGVDGASSGTISVAEGTYTETISINTKEFKLIGAGANTVIDPVSGNGINIFSAGSNLLVANLKITGADRGIYCDHASPAITNNLLCNNTYGIYCYNSSHGIITNNIIVANTNDGIYCHTSSSPIIINNTIDNNNCGLRCYYYASPVVFNNIISNSGSYGISSSSYPSPVIDYNNLWGNVNNYEGCSLGGFNIEVDPRFIDLEYRLGSRSLCIDSGSNTSWSIPVTDKDGNARIIRQIDMGAYEYQGNITISICGTITDTSGMPLCGILVEVLETERYDISDADGLYTISNLSIGSYTLRASIPTYYPSYSHNVEIVESGHAEVILEMVSIETTTIYVDNNNISGIENGSLCYPYSTIQRGVEGIIPYGTVCVAEGRYTEEVFINNKVLKLMGAGSMRSIITNPSGNGIHIFNTGDNLVIANFTITDAIKGIYCESSSPSIISNTIEGNTSGIYFQYSGGIVTNNVINNNSEYGVFLGNGTATIINNTLDNNRYGLFVDGSSPFIFNNIVTNQKATGIECRNNSHPTIDYNDLWNNVGTYSGCTGGTHDCFVDPKFVDSAYRIGSISLCIDSGTDEAYGVPATDKDGQPRIIRTIDIGAYEYQDTPGWGAICGVITDTSNNLLPGVFVEVLEKQVSVLSDINGAYFIRVPPSNTYTLCASVSTHYPSYRGKVEVTIDQTTSGVDIELVGKEVTTVYVNSENTTWIENGSREYSYTTIQRGVDYIVLLGTVSIAEGRYTESVSINNKEFRLVGAGINTVIDPPSGNGISIYSTGDNLVVANLKVTGAESGVYCDHASPIIIGNTIVYNSSAGIYCKFSSPSIFNNIIENNLYGVYSYLYSSPFLANNVIANREKIDGYGIYCSWYAGGDIINNTIDNHSIGIFCCYWSFPAIFNNIITNNKVGLSGSNATTADYNLFWQNETDYFGFSGGTYDYRGNPYFVNQEEGNYHLSTGISFAIDMGTETERILPATDFDGESRVLNNRVEIGADEFTGLPSPVLTAINPKIGMGDNTVRMNICGIRFQDGATVRLTKNTQPDIPGTTTWEKIENLTVFFDLSESDVGIWTVVVTNPDGESGSLTDAFTIIHEELGMIEKVCGDEQIGTICTTLKPFTIKLTDTSGEPVGFYPIMWEVIGLTYGANLSATSTLTNSEGTTSVFLTLGVNPGVYRVNAYASDTVTTTFTTTGLVDRIIW